MRTYHRTLLLGALALMLLGAAVSTTHAQGMKVGYIDDEKIKTEFKDWQRAQDQWQVEQKAWDDAAQVKQDELQTLLEEYDKQKLILSEEKKQERENAIRAKRDSLDLYTRQIYGPGGTAERKQMELINPLLEKIHKAVQAVALEGNYDMIFSQAESGLSYIKAEYDVTDKVLEQLDKVDQ